MSARVNARKPKARRPQARDSLLSRLLQSSDGKSFLMGLRAAGNRLTVVDAVVPPGTFLDTVVRQIREKTDLPPELGLAVVHSTLTAALAQGGSTVHWPGDSQGVELAMWMIALAPSGAGKTFIRKLVTEALGLRLHELPEPGSARAFLNALAEGDGKTLWVRDEYGQAMRQIADGGPLAGIRDYMLRAYDHSRLEIKTASSGEACVEYPVLSIFGASVDSTWASCIDAAMLSDGLLARHLFVVAERRPLTVPRYPTESMRECISAAAGALRERLSVSAQRYTITPAAARLYDHLWMESVGQFGQSVDAAYFRRVTWSASRYAVVYHLMLDKPGTEIGVDAMRWAWRMVLLHLEYARQVLTLSDAGFAAKIERILSWVETQVAVGADPTSNSFVRELCRHFSRDLASASEARQLIDLARKSAKNG